MHSEGHRFADDNELQHSVREDDPTLQQEVSDRQTACHAEVENVC
jgi:hypothetical protein